MRKKKFVIDMTPTWRGALQYILVGLGRRKLGFQAIGKTGIIQDG